MTFIKYLTLLSISLFWIACETIPKISESSGGETKKFKGDWILASISCDTGDAGSLGKFFEFALNNEASKVSISAIFSEIEGSKVKTIISSAHDCLYKTSHLWERGGKQLKISNDAELSFVDGKDKECSSKLEDFKNSLVFKSLLPTGDFVIEQKNTKIYLSRMLGSSSEDLELCKASKRITYILEQVDIK